MFIQRYSNASYAQQLMRLLPTGAAWTRDIHGDLYQLMAGMALELGRLDASLMDLVNNAAPSTASTMLQEWEKQVGLPNACFDIPESLAARRALVKRIMTWPGALPVGYTATGNLEKGSHWITGVSSTAGILVGECVSVSSGIGGGYYKVLEKTTNSLRIENPAAKIVSGASLVGYICEPGISDRFFRALATDIDYSIISIDIGETFMMGMEVNGWSDTATITEDSNILEGVDTTGLEVGGYLTAFTGFEIGELLILELTATTIAVNKNALATGTADLVGYKKFGSYFNKTCGMGDPIGSGVANEITFSFASVTAANEDLFECLMESLRPAHLKFVYNYLGGV